MNPIIIIRRTAAERFTSALIDTLRAAAVYQDEPWDRSEFIERPVWLLRKIPFRWVTHSGDVVDLRNMATPHVYYALRMVWNHSVPEEFCTPESIHPVKKYKDVPHWSRTYRKIAVDALSKELAKRDPAGLTPAMRDGLRWMKMATRAILKEGV